MFRLIFKLSKSNQDFHWGKVLSLEMIEIEVSQEEKKDLKYFLKSMMKTRIN